MPERKKTATNKKRAASSKAAGSTAGSAKSARPLSELTPEERFDRQEEVQVSLLAQPLFPWLAHEFSELLELQKKDRLPHALLMHGPAGMGKHVFAAYLCISLLCENPGTQHCGQCSSCQQFLSRNHPDYRHIHPTRTKSKSMSTYIRVEDIRDAREFLQLTNQYVGKKVALIDMADNMNVAAANSLLKSLEEPSAGTVFVLLADSLTRIPATIISRCRRIPLRMEATTPVNEWLQSQGVESPELALRVSGNSPLRAISLFKGTQKDGRQRLFAVYRNTVMGKASIAKSVGQVSDIPTGECLSTFLSFTADIVKCLFGASQECKNIDLRDEFQQLCMLLGSERWLTVYDQLLQLHRIDSVSFKTQPVLETVFAVIRLERTALD